LRQAGGEEGAGGAYPSSTATTPTYVNLLVLTSVSAIAFGAALPIAAINGISWLTLFVIVCSSLFFLSTYSSSLSKSPPTSDVTQRDDVTEAKTETLTATQVVIEDEENKKIYRHLELRRIVATLLADSSILVAGEQGIGKSTLATAAVKMLQAKGFKVAFIKPATSKEMLLEIAKQLSVETQNIEGKSLNTERLKTAIADSLMKKTAFLVIDNAERCALTFRTWLNELHKEKKPILLFATDPPRTDIFISIPRIELEPLPDYAIRELMEQSALRRGINLTTSDLAKLQERVGGNPMFAARVIEEEYLGIEIEAGDHRRYFDMTPVIMLVGVVFVVMRFMALGANNPAMYIFTGSCGALFMGLSYAMRALPKEGRRIRL
jgi:ABC-type dipeptide/oligopeptide/nickel transport system ATPase subunit